MAIRFLILLVLSVASMQLHAQTVNASNTPAAIPDGDANGVDILFNVPGTSTEVTSVSLMIELEQTWLGDLSATLTSPNGEAEMVIFSRVGAQIGSSFGDSSNVNGKYLFDDRGADLWQAAVVVGNTETVPPGVYTTSTAGQPGLSSYGGRKTSMAGVFGNLITDSDGVQGVGQWVLNVADHEAGDPGNVVSATLMINTADLIFRNGLDVPAVQAPKNRLDLSGNGLADFGTLGDGGSSDLTFRILENISGGNTGALDTFVLGNSSTDFWNSADFDGDGIADAAAFDTQARNYLIKRSGRPGASHITIPMDIGITNSNPLVVGDYDGDGIDDPAVYNPGINDNDPISLTFRSSATGQLITVPMGIRGPNFTRALGGHDYTGDGIADMIFNDAGSYTIRDGKNGLVVDTFTFGTGTEAVMLFGNYAGDNRGDITLVSVSGNDVIWQTRETGPGTELPQVIWGQVGIAGFAEFAASGDYDGDGILDYATWRRDNTTPDNAQFIIRPSTNTSSTINVFHGTTGEAPLADAQAG